MMESEPSPTPTVRTPNYYEGPSAVQDDVHLSFRYFTYQSQAGLVAGAEASVMFTIDRPAKHVWPYFKDFNLWQNSYGYYYSSVIGDLYAKEDHDLGGETFALGLKADDLGPHRYRVLRVIPERLIVLHQPVPKGDGKDPYAPGLGGVSPGFHVFMLNEHQGKTIVTILMEHGSRTEGLTEEQALRPWRDEKMAPEWLRFWRDTFIPNLKKIIYEAQ